MSVQNDWIVANINNPGFTSQDMQDVLGMDLANTQILPKDTYEKSPFIQNNPMFANEDGTFNRDKFSRFYDSTLGEWSKFTEDEKIDNFEYSLFDTRATAESKIKDPHFRFETVLNPDRVTTGIGGWNQVGQRKMTPSELAQTQKIWDPETNSFLDETPNDKALTVNPLKFVTSLFEDPIMMATWDEDGEHFDLASGQIVKHRKGQYKLNEDGTYYTEKVRGRSTVGKQVLSSLDMITVDGTPINKYDFFDSDSLDKSVGGTIAKNVAAVAPLFFGPVGEIYSGIMIARELTKSLPMLYGMTTALFGNEEDSSILNTLSAYGQKFTGGTSEYGQTHTFSFEQIGNMMADVAVQWGQQKLIAKAVNSLRGGNKVLQHADDLAKIEYDKQVAKLTSRIKEGYSNPKELVQYAADLTGKGDWRNSLFGQTALQKYMPKAEAIMKRNSRIGADAALAYMAIVSNYDVYNTMLDHGTTKKEAALVSLGSTLGMFSVDKYLGLGEMFFDDLQDQAQTAVRRYTKEEASKWAESIANANNVKTFSVDETKGLFGRTLANAANKNAAIKDATLLRKGINLGKALGEEIKNAKFNFKEGVLTHTLNASGKALGEGLEEVSEEFVTDITKQLYEWAGQLGFDTSTNDVGAWDNAFDRYAMSFLGGMAGGGLFYGIGKVQEAMEDRKNPQAKDAEKEVVYLLRQHKKDDIMKELKTLHDKGRLGSTKLGIESALDSQSASRQFLTVKEGAKTQNDVIYDRIVESINQIDSYLNEYGANLSEDELFKQMVLGNERLMAIKDKLDGASYASNYRQGFQSALEKVISAREELAALEKDLTDLEKSKLKAAQDEQKAILENLGIKQKAKDTTHKALQEAETELQEFLSGKKSMYYARKTAWLADPIVSAPFTYHTFDQWLFKKKGLLLNNLSVAEKEKFKDEYLVDLNAKKKLEDDEMFDMFLQIERDFTPYLTQLEQSQDTITQVSEQLKKIREFEEKIQDTRTRGLLTWDQKLEDESDDDFAERNSPLEGETEEQFTARRQERKAKIEAANEKLFEDEDKIVKLYQELTALVESVPTIDPRTHRELKGFVKGINRKIAFNRAIRSQLFGQVTDGTLPYSDFAQKYIFDFSKKALTIALDQIKDAYQKQAKVAQAKSEKAIKLKGFLESGDIEQLVKQAINSVELSDEIFKNSIDVNNIDPDNEDEVNQLINTVISNPDILTKIGENVNNYVQNSVANFQIFTDAALNEEIATTVIDGIKESMNDATDLVELNVILLTALGEEGVLPIENSVKDNVVAVYNAVNEATKNLFSNLINVNSEEDLKTTLQSGLITVADTVTTTLANSSYETLARDANDSPKIEKLFRSSKNFKDVISDATQEFITKFGEDLPKVVINDAYVKFYDTVDAKLVSKSPIHEIAKLVSDKYGIADGDIDEVLDNLQTSLDSLEDSKDFVLLPHQEQALDYLNFIFGVVKGYIHQSAVTPTWLGPFGHAKFWNDFASKHADIVGQGFHIPELNGGLALQIKEELSAYQREIDSWKKLHEENVVDKERQNIVAGQKLEEAKLSFYKNNIKAFRTGLTLNDLHLDILDDIEDGETSLDIETKLANNLFAILSKGISLKEFLEKTHLIENILPNGNIEDLLIQGTSALDSKLSYGDMSGYQRLQILLSALLHNTSKFEKYNKENLDKNPDIAPIVTQKQIIQSGKGFINGAYIISQIYSYVKSKLGAAADSIPILDRFMIIEGVGGAGKTTAVIKQIVEDVEEKDIWLAAPAQEQLSGLVTSVGKSGKSFNKDALMSQIIEDTTAYKATLDSILKGKGDENFKRIEANGGTLYIDTGALKLKSTTNAPRVLVIDEVTHFSNYDLQLINRWAAENNVQVITSGDQFQLGSIYGNSISEAYCFTLFRTPKLSVSLRESNSHVQGNNNAIATIVQEASNYANEVGMTSDENAEKLKEFVTKRLSGLTLTSYYANGTFNGTIVDTSIPDEILEIIKSDYLKTPDSERSKIVAFVGDASKSKVAKQLKDAGIILETGKNTFIDVRGIQGREFDYIISDINFSIQQNEQSNYLGEDSLNLVRKLYTLNTRGKKGVVITNNDFDSAIGASITRAATTAQAQTLSKSVKLFKDSETKRLGELNLDGEYHDISEIKPTKPKDVKETASGENTEEVETEEVEEEQVDLEQQLKDQDAKRENAIKEVTAVEHERDVDEQQSNSVESAPNMEITDPRFSMKSVGYFMPILGGYTRTGKSGETHKYVRLANNKVGETTILEDLAAITILDKDIPSSENSELTLDKLKESVGKYQKLVRQLVTKSVIPDFNAAQWSDYISRDELIKILNGTSTQKLADGRTAGIYLEAQDYKPGDRFIGMGSASDAEADIAINGKVYKYVLRFKPTSYTFTSLGKDYEIAITLSLAANPTTWEKRLDTLKADKEKAKDVAKQTAIQKEIDTTKKNIANYIKYLEAIASSDTGVKVSLQSAFTKIRHLEAQTRLGSLHVTESDGRVKYERGWLDEVGQYKSVSDVYVLGSDLDELGIKASNSGKVAVFVSEFDYNPKDLIQIYKEEKESGAACTVRMLIMDNAGINWTSLTKPSYKELYRSKIGATNNGEVTFNFPFKSEAMGYRFLAAMWNWRANLTKFLKAYSEAFNDEDDKVLKIIGAADEIYEKNGTIPEDLSGFTDILNKFGVTNEDIKKLQDFNLNTCKDIHVFRLGGYKHGKRVQRLDVSPKDYFGNSKIAEYVKTSGVIGLAVTPQIARMYLDFTQGIFDIFSNKEAGIQLSEVSITHENGHESTYSITDRMNADRLGSLAQHKGPDDQRVSGNSLTNLLDNLSTVSAIKVDDGEGNVYNISFENVGTGRQLSQFMGLVTHLYTLMRNSAYLANQGITPNPGSLHYKITGSDAIVKLDYTALQQRVTASVGEYDTEKGRLINQTVPVESPKFRFEFGDMFDLMLHGTLSDVSTHALEFDPETHRVTGGRDDHNKISDSIFKRGIFVDPRAGAKEMESANSNTLLFRTDLNPSLVLTNTTTDLALQFKLPTLGPEPEVVEPTYTLNTKLEIDLESPLNELTPSTMVGDRTWRQIIEDFGGTIDDTGLITVGDKQYDSALVNNGFKIKLSEHKKLNAVNNTLGSIDIEADVVEDLRNMELNHSTVIDEDDLTLGQFIVNTIGDKIAIDELSQLIFTRDPANSNKVFIYYDHTPIGYLVIEDSNLAFNLEGNLASKEEVESTSEVEPEDVIPSIPDNISSIVNDYTNIADSGDYKQLLEFYKAHAEEFNITGQYLEQIDDAIKNDSDLLLMSGWLAEIDEKLQNMCFID